MNEDQTRQRILAFADVDTTTDSGNTFFFYNPASLGPPDYMFPFATIVNSDVYEKYSNLNRPSVFRLSIGVAKQAFLKLFGPDDPPADFDYTVLDELMPHPEYGQMRWLCILSPSDETFEAKVAPLLNEAYEIAVSKRARSANRG